MERVPSGIKGLDELIEGGFPKRRAILITGACGTGKTIFCMQYIYNGAKVYEEPGVFVSLDASPDILREDMATLGWDIKKLEDEGLLRIVDGNVARLTTATEEQLFSLPSEFDLEKLLIEIVRNVKQIGAKRVAIDSLPGLGLNFSTMYQVRTNILKLDYLLRRYGVTTLFTSEIYEGESRLGRYGVEEFITDGVIILYLVGLGIEHNRGIQIRKMRGTKHVEDLMPMRIGKNGIEILKKKL